MLSELNMVGNWFKNEPENGWRFDEVKFDDEAKRAIEALDLDIEVFAYSARVDVASNSNHCYIPSHYFLYALKLLPLVVLIDKYMCIFDEVAATLTSANGFDALVNSGAPSNIVTSRLDTYSCDNFFNVFRDKSYRLEAKNIINKDGPVNKKYRSTDDFARSIMLKALPVPDASSGMLGKLIYAFSKNLNSYQTLFNKYCSNIPYLFNSSNGDELILMIFSCLGWQGKLESLLGNDPTARLIVWEDVTDAFLLSPTPVSGNTQYIDKPVHYSVLLKKYVHIKKGLLDSDELIVIISKLISHLWPSMSIHKGDGEFLFRSSGLSTTSALVFEGATNKIFYGAPGTGKSHKILTEECQDAEKVVTVFHPDTQYNDFVGALKPMMEKDGNGNSVVTYQFRPGPFTNALVKAKSQPDKHICLVIEEINRAPAAAVFGELFQLLDRKENGKSAYKIDAADPDMLMYINEQFRAAGTSEIAQLEIPANLSIFATMNSSDQAVMPLDTAFKRRWSFEYLEIDFTNPAVPKTAIELRTKNDLFSIEWPALAEIINDELSEKGITEDRLIGPFFLNPKELGNSTSAKDAINGKLFVYLWDDVLRHLGHHNVFSSAYKTFGKLSRAFIKNEAVFSRKIEEKIEVKGTKVEVVEASQDGTE